jgi:hypothetical protein
MYLGAVTAMMVWKLDLQLPMQSVPITTTIASSNMCDTRCSLFGSTFVTSSAWNAGKTS